MRLWISWTDCQTAPTQASRERFWFVRSSVRRKVGCRGNPWQPVRVSTAKLRECVNVLLTGAEEIEEVDPFEFAGFTDAEQDQILFDSLFGREALEVPSQKGKGFDRMFRVIVVPRYAVVVQKREEGVSILFQALLVSQGGLALAISARETLEKAIHVGLVSTQESRLQSKPINCLDHRL